MRFAFIADQAALGAFPVAFICKHLKVSPSGYYAWVRRAPSAHSRRDAELSTKIKKIFDLHKRRYGVRRIFIELTLVEQVKVSYKRVARLMKEMGLASVHPRPRRITTVPDLTLVGPTADLLRRHVNPAAPDTKYVGDITYINTAKGWAYLATVIDCASRMVVGFATADHMRTSLVHDALQMALVRRRPAAGVIFHSDRGAQYTSKDFRKFCTSNGVRPSVGATGSCFDNAVAESFFATIKKELIHLRSWDSVTTVKTAIFDYIERYYNRRRRHSTLNYLTPAEYNAKFDNKMRLAA